jgi:transposase
MKKVRLKDSEWGKIQTYLRGRNDVKIGSVRGCRRFLEGVLWVLRSGAQWRLVPKEYGKWNSVYRRFARWCEAGIWEAMLTHLAADADMESVLVDATIVRAHPSAAGAEKKTVVQTLKPSDAAEAGSLAKSMPV